MNTSEYVLAGFTQSLAIQFIKSYEYILRTHPTGLEISAVFRLGALILSANRYTGGVLTICLICPYLSEPPNSEMMANATAQIVLIGTTVKAGWLLKYAEVLLSTEDILANAAAPQGTDLVVWNSNLNTVAFIHVEARLLGSEVDKIAPMLLEMAKFAKEAISTHASNRFAAYWEIPVNNSTSGVVTLIAYQSDLQTINRLLDQLKAGNPESPIVIIWVDSNGLIHSDAACPHNSCPNGWGSNTQGYATEFAASLGFPVGQTLETASCFGNSCQFMFDMYMDLLDLCVGDQGCADYLYWWWIDHYGCGGSGCPPPSKDPCGSQPSMGPLRVRPSKIC